MKRLIIDCESKEELYKKSGFTKEDVRILSQIPSNYREVTKHE